MTGILLFSCHKDNPQEKLLKQAQDSLGIGKPAIAQNLLASLQNPEKMDKESYMQYIVIYVGAKYETKADITKDTLIFEAQRYFNKKEDLKYTVLSNYYTAQLYDESGNFPKALESYMLAVSAADKSNNDLLAGKSLNNIGYIYFEQELLDSAIINYKKALLYYNKVENTDQRKLKTFINIGRSYEGDNKLDSAYFYFKKGLNLAKQTDYKLEESQLYLNLGATCYGKREYEKAIEYYQSALSMGIMGEVQIQKINLIFLKIYNEIKDLSKAKQYADLIVLDLPKVSNKYTIKEMQDALSEYYENIGDYKQALAYSKLEKATQGQIEQQKNAPALLEADKSFYIDQKEKEAQIFRSNAIFVFFIGASAFCILLVFFLFVWRNHKKNQAEIKFYAEKYAELREVLYAHTDEYPKIEAEIKSILEDD
ncbi:tetratricopeptide repeat protein [Dysgonomonas sp. HDW5B]|uniref:tetratricopeptide repeat protein n=1 Tax=Dysgonomonas sp. HDW5B TaxID=2714927 RepID=UPI0014091BCC|nr:tetratricopeptide repeat protein [Dysgonomonas sp. HDW5B]QIK52916.1 tetratricopeptide repeat protein [Dysgonomonas sp. HDW5B]